MSVKKHNVNIRVTAKQRAELKRAAKARGITVSELMLSAALPLVHIPVPPQIAPLRLSFDHPEEQSTESAGGEA